jgi:hypothetical protein
LAEQFISIVAKQLLDARVGDDDGARPIDHEDAIRGCLAEFLKKSFAETLVAVVRGDAGFYPWCPLDSQTTRPNGVQSVRP